MSIDLDDAGRGARDGARKLLARAAAAESYAHRRLVHAIDDFFIPDDTRLDDRLRALLGATLIALVSLVEVTIRRQAARSVSALRDVAVAVIQGPPVIDRLVDAGMLRDIDLMSDLISRVRLDLLADVLPPAPQHDEEDAGLFAQLTASGDADVAAATRAMMAAAATRRGFLDSHRLMQTELPAELHHRLVWWVAAAVREQVASDKADRAIAQAAMQALANHDESASVENAAARLAGAIDALPEELPMILYRSLAERQLTLFVALLSRALDVDYAAMRDIVVDDNGDRLWLVLRAIGVERADMARIAVQWSQVQAVSRVEALAVQIDAVGEISPDEARDALAVLRLPPDFRAAVQVLGERR